MQETTYTTDQTEAISAGEQRIAKARSAHGSAVTELIAALESQVVRKTLALYPTAVTLVTNTHLGEDIALDCGWHMHPERVLDANGAVIAGCEPTNIDNRWDAYCDSVTDYLVQTHER